VRPLDCLGFQHYQFILTDKENWTNIFSKIFSDKEWLLARLNILKDVRDSVAHARGEFGTREKLEVISTIRSLKNLMNKQKKLLLLVWLKTKVHNINSPRSRTRPACNGSSRGNKKKSINHAPFS